MNWNNSPSSESILTVLKLLLGEDIVFCQENHNKGNIQILSYREDFKYLWDVNNKRLLQGWIIKGGIKTIVLVWDEMPVKKYDYPLDTSRYLTPLDWAVSFSLNIHKYAENSDADYPELRIFILDLVSHQNRHADGVKFFNQFPKRDVSALPWVRLISSIPKDGQWDFANLIANVLYQEKSGISDRPDWLLPTMKACFDQPENPDLEFLKRVWASYITKPSVEGDRHAISNVLGPLVLVKAGLKGDFYIKALHNLLSSIGLIGEKKTKPQKKTIRISSLDKLQNVNISDHFNDHSIIDNYFEQLKKIGIKRLELLLIDDMVFEGWGEVLCKYCDVPYQNSTDKNNNRSKINKIGDRKTHNLPIEIYAASSAEWIIDLLNQDENQRYNLNLCQTDTSNLETAQILFLDLRLFSGRGEDSEKEFIESLLKIAKQYVCLKNNPFISADNNKQLPWVGFDQEEIEAVEKWAKNPVRETPEYFTALTLLPRILALTDLSLPIVIFSSTGKREIIGKLKPYRNIITLFDKPRFFGYSSENLIDDTKDKFTAAYIEALKLTYGRCLCAQLNKHQFVFLNYFDAKYKEGGGNWTIEIMLDETGTMRPLFTVGGLIVICPPSVSEKNYIHRIIKENYSDNGINNVNGKTYFKDNRKIIINLIEKSIKDKEIFIAGIALTYSLDQNDIIPSRNKIEDIRLGDNVNRILLDGLLDSVIYIYLRHLLPHGSSVHINVYCSTRPIKTVDFIEEDLKNLEKHWGLIPEQNFHGDWVLKVFRSDSVLPLISNLLDKYKFAELNHEYKTTRAWSTNAHGELGASYVKPLHWIADAFIDKYHEPPENNDLIDHKWWNNGVEETYNSVLQTILKANQYFLVGDDISCILTAGNDLLKYINSGNSNSNILERFIVDVKESTQRIDGQSFFHFVVNSFQKTMSGKEKVPLKIFQKMVS